MYTTQPGHVLTVERDPVVFVPLFPSLPYSALWVLGTCTFDEHSSGEAGPRVVPARRPRPPPVGTQNPLSQALQVYLPLSSPRAAHVLVVTKGC